MRKRTFYQMLVVSLGFLLVVGVACNGDDDENGDGTNGCQSDDDCAADEVCSAAGECIAGVPLPSICQEECSVNADCIATFICDDDNLCVPEDEPVFTGCTSDDECVAQQSGWVLPLEDDCATDADCTGMVCVKVGAIAKCATESAPPIDCATLGLEEVTANKKEDDSEVAVCAVSGAADATCGTDGICENPCADDSECLGGTICNDNNRCVICEDDTQCEGGEFTKCVVDFGICGCANNDECTDFYTGNVCDSASGICGCSSADDCTGTRIHNETTEWVCQ